MGLCGLFNANYFDFLDPAHFGADGLLGMLASQKFITTKVLLAFPLICALLLTWGRLRWILLLSLLGQVVSTLYTKSRGGVFSMAALALLFGGAMLWELGRWRGLLALLGLVAAAAAVLASSFWDKPLRPLLHRPAPGVFRGSSPAIVVGLRQLGRRSRRQGVLLRNNNIEYVAALLLIIWVAHFVPAIRNTTFEMLERTSKLFHPAEVRVTPRLFIWHSALAMLRDNPLFGKGLDTFQISFPPYREALYWILEWNGTPEKAHNFVMQTAATMGFMGLLVLRLDAHGLDLQQLPRLAPPVGRPPPLAAAGRLRRLAGLLRPEPFQLHRGGLRQPVVGAVGLCAGHAAHLGGLQPFDRLRAGSVDGVRGRHVDRPGPGRVGPGLDRSRRSSCLVAGTALCRPGPWAWPCSRWPCWSAWRPGPR